MVSLPLQKGPEVLHGRFSKVYFRKHLSVIFGKIGISFIIWMLSCPSNWQFSHTVNCPCTCRNIIFLYEIICSEINNNSVQIQDINANDMFSPENGPYLNVISLWIAGSRRSYIKYKLHLKYLNKIL